MKALLIATLLLASCTVVDQPMYVVERVDYEHRIYHVKLRSDLVEGSDGANRTAGIVINFLLERDPAWRVWITNDWVPSRYNPIDLEQSRTLITGGY